MKIRTVISVGNCLAFVILLVHSGTAEASQQTSAVKPESRSVATQTTSVVSTKQVVARSSKLNVKSKDKVYFKDRFTVPGTSSGYVCETTNNFTSCQCSGANDCYDLITSGKCNGEGKTWWEDINDPSIGGCDGKDG
jgi:hypothetical protein